VVAGKAFRNLSFAGVEACVPLKNPVAKRDVNGNGEFIKGLPHIMQ